MPRDPRTSNRRLTRLVVFAVAGWVVLALNRLLRPTADPAGHPAPRPRRRLVTPFATAVIFFAGASLTAVAGDRMGGVLQPDAEEDAALVVAEGAEAQAEAAVEPAPVEGEAEPADPDPLRLGTATPPAPEIESAPEADAPAEPAQAEAAPEPAPAEPVARAAVEPATAPVVEAVAADEELRPVTAATSDPAAVAAPVVEESSAPVLAAAATAPAAMKEHEHDDDHGHDHASPLDPEASAPDAASTVWLHRVLPDPTPPSRRLAPRFAEALVRASKKEGVHWSLVLGALRAERENAKADRMFSASRASVAQTAAGLAAVGGRKRTKAWTAVLSLEGDTTLADRAVVLADYYRAVGLRALVRGLRSQEKELVKRVLDDERITIYGGGRADLAEGRVDVRVVATIAFLAESFGQVTVSSLISGHGLYSRPGVISRHIYGQAVDIAALDNQIVSPFTQNPGGLVEQAVRKELLLPAELRPQQVISLLGLGGPSFPLANHDDHVHIGF
jgi:hypothetical protein